MKRIVNTPLKTFGVLTILLGLSVAILTYGYLVILGLYFIGAGLILYLVDHIIPRFFKNKRPFWAAQWILSVCYLLFASWVYLKWQEHNSIIFPKNYKGQAGIIFGIEGYPKLPETKFWTKTIKLPENGIIITSTKVEDVPSFTRYYYKDNSLVDMEKIDWEPNFEFDCIVCDSKIVSWIFTVDDSKTGIIKDTITKLCNQIATKQLSSAYLSEHSSINTDEKGKYLWLQNRGITSLPDGLDQFSLYKVILTGNNLTEIPEQILQITSLEDLVIAVNPITDLPKDLNKLQKLRSISVAETNIKEIKIDLSHLDSLEHFDLARNNLIRLPDEIKNIPNLKWLSVNENDFDNISFIDERLSRLETLHVYSNKLKRLSFETKFLPNLKELLIFDNKIDSIPDNISDLANLENLEFWDNPIKYISPMISKLTSLKSIRLDDDFLTVNDKENLKKWLPNCQINFQTRRSKQN